MRSISFFSILLIAVATACGPGPTHQSTPAKSAGCQDQGPALPQSGICQGRAGGYLAFAGGERPAPPQGCKWVVNETSMPGGEYLLYLAAECKGKVTALEFEGGAHMAHLSYVTSALAGDVVKGQKVVEIGSAEPSAPNAAVLTITRAAIKNGTEAAKCQVRPAKIAGWPADAVVVDVSAAEAAKAPKDEPRTACGPYGLDEDSQRFWRVFQGFAWFFELGQDEMEIDPGSFTIVRKDDRGNWVRAD